MLVAVDGYRRLAFIWRGQRLAEWDRSVAGKYARCGSFQPTFRYLLGQGEENQASNKRPRLPSSTEVEGNSHKQVEANGARMVSAPNLALTASNRKALSVMIHFCIKEK